MKEIKLYQIYVIVFIVYLIVMQSMGATFPASYEKVTVKLQDCVGKEFVCEIKGTLEKSWLGYYTIQNSTKTEFTFAPDDYISRVDSIFIFKNTVLWQTPVLMVAN